MSQQPPPQGGYPPPGGPMPPGPPPQSMGPPSQGPPPKSGVDLNFGAYWNAAVQTFLKEPVNWAILSLVGTFAVGVGFWGGFQRCYLIAKRGAKPQVSDVLWPFKSGRVVDLLWGAITSSVFWMWGFNIALQVDRGFDAKGARSAGTRVTSHGYLSYAILFLIGALISYIPIFGWVVGPIFLMEAFAEKFGGLQFHALTAAPPAARAAPQQPPPLGYAPQPGQPGMAPPQPGQPGMAPPQPGQPGMAPPPTGPPPGQPPQQMPPPGYGQAPPMGPPPGPPPGQVSVPPGAPPQQPPPQFGPPTGSPPMGAPPGPPPPGSPPGPPPMGPPPGQPPPSLGPPPQPGVPNFGAPGGHHPGGAPLPGMGAAPGSKTVALPGGPGSAFSGPKPSSGEHEAPTVSLDSSSVARMQALSRPPPGSPPVPADAAEDDDYYGGKTQALEIKPVVRQPDGGYACGYCSNRLPADAKATCPFCGAFLIGM